MFLEVKGSDGVAAIAKRQLAYDMALGARGQHTLHSYKAPQPIFDNKAYSIGCSYSDGQLKMYAIHPIEPPEPGVEPGYVMTQTKAFAMTNDLDTFRQGAAAYRNGRDWAKRQRDEAIKRANKAARDEVDGLGLSFASVVSAADRASSLYDSDTSADPADVARSANDTEVSETQAWT